MSSNYVCDFAYLCCVLSRQHMYLCSWSDLRGEMCEHTLLTGVAVCDPVCMVSGCPGWNAWQDT